MPQSLPKDYVIGVEDVLNVVFWNAKELSAEVLVRPDGKISLPLLNDVPAAGMTPEQLAESIAKIGTKFVRDSGATVIVKEIHSRKVYVVGEVAKPGPFPLGSDMNVMQAIGEAGGFLEGAKKGDVVIVRNENGKSSATSSTTTMSSKARTSSRTSGCSRAIPSSFAKRSIPQCTDGRRRPVFSRARLLGADRAASALAQRRRRRVVRSDPSRHRGRDKLNVQVSMVRVHRARSADRAPAAVART